MRGQIVLSNTSPAPGFAAAFLLALFYPAVAICGGATITSTGDSTRTQNGDFCAYQAHGAEEALEKKDYKAARAGYDKAIKWTHDTCDVTISEFMLAENYRGRAQASVGLGDYVSAANDIAKILRASSLGNERDFTWMVPALDEAIKRQPKNASFFGARAKILDAQARDYWIKGDTEHEISFTKLALADRDAQIKFAKTKAERAEALADRHFLNKTLKNPDQALVDINEAIELDANGEYYRRRAMFYNDQNDPAARDEAIADINKAIEFEPQKFFYYKLAAEIYESAGKPDKAIEILTKAVSLLSPDAPVYKEYMTKRAELYRAGGQLDEAAKDYAALIEAYPDSGDLHATHLLVLMEQGRDADAEDARKKLAALDQKLEFRKRTLTGKTFLCEATDMFASRYSKAGKAATGTDLRKAWNMGQIVSLVPLVDFIDKQDPELTKAWAALSQFVAGAQKSNGQKPTGLPAISKFEGSAKEKLEKTLAFIATQRDALQQAVSEEMGQQASAMVGVAAALQEGELLSKLGVPNRSIVAVYDISLFGPETGIACDVWVGPMQEAFFSLGEKPKEVTAAAWAKTRAAFKTENDRLLEQPEQASAKGTQGGASKAAQRVHARHILVATEAEARAIIDKLKAGADFAELAKENSIDPNASNGGDLGFFGRGEMLPAFEEAAFALKPGEVSQPVKTQFGWHVIMVEPTTPTASKTQ